MQGCSCTGVPGRVATDKYVLAQVHLHWGVKGSNLGSEHRVDGEPHPLELRLVQKNYD